MNYSKFIETFALAVAQHEGYNEPGSLPRRNNNPGDLRKNGQFLYFPSYYLGFAALEADIYAKCTNHSSAMTGYYQRNGKIFGTAVFQDVFNVYAPEADGNTPVTYCEAVCAALKAYNVTPSTSMIQIDNLAGGYWAQIPPTDNPSPPQPIVVDPPEVVRYLSRVIANTTNAIVRTRLLQRLLTYKQQHGIQ